MEFGLRRYPPWTLLCRPSERLNMKFKCFPSSSCGFARPKTSSHGRTAVLMVFEIGVCRPGCLLLGPPTLHLLFSLQELKILVGGRLCRRAIDWHCKGWWKRKGAVGPNNKSNKQLVIESAFKWFMPNTYQGHHHRYVHSYKGGPDYCCCVPV